MRQYRASGAVVPVNQPDKPEGSSGKYQISLKETSATDSKPRKRKSAPKNAKPAKPTTAEKSENATPPLSAQEVPPRDYVMPDLGRLAANLLRATNLGQKAARLLMQNENAPTNANHAMHDLQRVGRALMDVAASYMRNPTRIVEAQNALFEGYLNLATNITRRLLGEEVVPVATPSRSDKRFRDPEWQENIIFDLMKQTYLLTSKWMTDRVRLAADVDAHTRDKADFYVRQMANAFSPSNFLLTN